MPRAQMSQTGRIVDFFRKQPIEVAGMVLDLCKDAVAERKQKSQAAKAAQTKAAPAPAAAAAAPKKKAAAKKSHKKKAPMATFGTSGKAPAAPAAPTPIAEAQPATELAEVGAHS